MPRYCSNCGAKLSGTESFCPECGEQLDVGPDDSHTSSSNEKTRTTGSVDESVDVEHSNRIHSSKGGDKGAYFATIAGGLLWAGFLATALAMGPQDGTTTGTPYFGYLILLSGLSWLASIITMYVDLRSMTHKLWGTGHLGWVIGAILLYVVVVPLYVYKRHVSISD